MPQAAAFRDRHLDGQFLPLEEMTDWIKAQAASEGVLPPEKPYTMRRTLAFLSPTRRMVEVEIRSDGVLAELKEIAATLVKSYHTGCRIRPRRWSSSSRRRSRRFPWGAAPSSSASCPAPRTSPLRSAHGSPPREVAAFYSEIRRRHRLQGHDKPFAVKHLALAVFVERTMGSGEGWVKLRAQWNKMYAKPHPSWRYKPDSDPEAIVFSLEARERLATDHRRALARSPQEAALRRGRGGRFCDSRRERVPTRCRPA